MICEHMFSEPDLANPGYSQINFDLLARLNLTVRRNLRTKNFEIVRIPSGEVVFTSPGLPGIVEKAREMGDPVEAGCALGSALCAEGRK